LIKLIRFRNCK